MPSRFSRTLPARPDLDQQRTLAKDLLHAFDAGDAEARERIRDALPDKREIALADAQFTIAREYGFTDWASLKQHIDTSSATALSPEMQLHQAVHRRDAREMRRLFEQHPPLTKFINEPLFAFDSPAIVALSSDAAMVDVLLDFGADPNRKSGWWAGGFHALYGATPESAERLFAAGAVADACALAHLGRTEELAAMLAANPDAVHERGGDGQTPLHFASSRDVVDLLLDAGADIDARDVDHRSTPAEWMLGGPDGGKRTELARYLVSRGATADIFMAAALGLGERTRALLEEDASRLDLRVGRGPYGEQPPSSFQIYMWSIGNSRSPMETARVYGNDRVLEVMRTFASPRQRLLSALGQGDETEVQAISAAHPGIIASLDVADHALAADAAWNGNARALALMLDLGFDPRVPGHDSGTALHCAAWGGYVECVEMLVRRPDARELVAIEDAHYKATPLGWCCHGSVHGNTRRDHARIARLLLEAGADPGHGIRDASPAVTAVLEAHRRAAGR